MSFTLGIYGDSISTGSHGDGGYLAALREAGADPIDNHAVGSSSLVEVAPNSLVELLRSPGAVRPDLDVAIVWHGSNDWYWGSPVGTPGDDDPVTYYGAWKHCVGILRATCPGLPVVAPTPLWRYEAPAGSAAPGVAAQTPNRVGATLADYRAALQTLAPTLGLTLVDLDPAGIGAASEAELLEDHVHPNRQGYERLAPLLVAAVLAARPDSL